jgi:hypothetical protein
MKHHRKKRDKPNNASSILKKQKRNRFYAHWLRSEHEKERNENPGVEQQ